ncbi:hypothetical protein SAMN05428949_0643 [Chitinophaga sp. YR627]|uniref:hypothetical protein n=1 Tax=Chitinophaga sp. YR627 TaxID=1881041 RepID=UPI0008EDF875|nr:hypothetical protein [Chitinophaga sp. YR627]SFM74524.1 hypothetical protein SAMN05428949_0643 [Chitinophaga sp. YR627]
MIRNKSGWCLISTLLLRAMGIFISIIFTQCNDTSRIEKENKAINDFIEKHGDQLPGIYSKYSASLRSFDEGDSILLVHENEGQLSACSNSYRVVFYKNSDRLRDFRCIIQRDTSCAIDTAGAIKAALTLKSWRIAFIGIDSGRILASTGQHYFNLMKMPESKGNSFRAYGDNWELLRGLWYKRISN